MSWYSRRSVSLLSGVLQDTLQDTLQDGGPEELRGVEPGMPDWARFPSNLATLVGIPMHAFLKYIFTFYIAFSQSHHNNNTRRRQGKRGGGAAVKYI